MDYVLIAVIVFMASYIGTALATKNSVTKTAVKAKPIHIVRPSDVQGGSILDGETDSPIFQEINAIKEWFAKKEVTEDEE